MFITGATVSCAPNIWHGWVEHVMKQRQKLAFRSVSLSYGTGSPAASTSGFSLHPCDVLRLKKLMTMSADERPESVSVKGKTYIIKSVEGRQLVAFNGKKYIICNLSKDMIIVALVSSRTKSNDAAHWLNRLNRRLIERNY